MRVILPLSTYSRVPITYGCPPSVTMTSVKVLQRLLSRMLLVYAIGSAVFHSPLSGATSLMFSRYFAFSAKAIFLASPARCATT